MTDLSINSGAARECNSYSARLAVVQALGEPA